ncbi:MAG: phosphohistidine phosphatase SixA [Candidatus Melainabacteria bacterium RIFCSPHIGHO2_02_FULL_34_12]|nr:MAG: phosphohistidine phosphatase SixA [Candidatus Melainabacteria bacterium RIFCSPHIGHO2_02_FULL_34_12]
MQEIFILRHGHAEDNEGSTVKNDFDRKLTEEGKEKIRKISLFLNKLEEEIELVISSPYIRAKETAEILISNLTPKPNLKIEEFLSSGASCKEIVKGLMPYLSLKKVLLVGHAPDLSTFLGKLIGAEHVKLKKGALAKIELNNSIELSGELAWLITPKVVKEFKLKEKAVIKGI